MSLLDRVRGERKAFVQPPFWAQSSSGSFSSWNQEMLEADFVGYVEQLYKGNSVVFAAIQRRAQVFSQARFRWRGFRGGRPGDLFSNPSLDILDTPWPNGTTGELLSLMEADASIAGNSYWTIVDGRMVRLRPDWVRLVIDSPSGNPYAVDARVVAFLYRPPQGDPMVLLPAEVCHYSPLPDPLRRYVGMSWLRPLLSDIAADKAATEHKMRSLENGTVTNLALVFDRETSPDDFDAFVQRFKEEHAGPVNSGKPLFLGGGIDPRILTANFRDLELKATQGAGETRIAVASGVPAAILGISEGLAGSSLNAGNFQAARRLFVDSTVRDLWSKAAASLESLLPVPTGARLWYDDRDIPFLREDADQNAQIRYQDAQTIRTLTDGGVNHDAAVAFARTGDLSLLTGQHSGLFSVQLQEPGTTTPVEETDGPQELPR